MKSIVLYNLFHNLEKSGQFTLCNPLISSYKELYISSYRVFCNISLTLYHTYVANGVENMRIRKFFLSHLCYRNDDRIKKAKIKFSGNLLLAQFFFNILRHFVDEVVPFIFMNHPVLSLQVK